MHIEQNYSYLIIREGLWSFEKYIFLLQKPFLSNILFVSLLFYVKICAHEQEFTSTELEKLEEYKSIARASLYLPSFTCL